VEGVAREQAIEINSSLTSLGRVINALSGPATAHVPYRDSTLTMLLRSAFGGKSRTSVVVSIADEAQHADETLRSLQFGERLAVVKNVVTVATGSDAAGRERVELSNALDIVRGELSKLAATGQAAGPNVVCSTSQAADFRANDGRMSALDGSIRRVRVSLQETGSKDTVKELRLLEATAKTLRSIRSLCGKTSPSYNGALGWLSWLEQLRSNSHSSGRGFDSRSGEIHPLKRWCRKGA
jgi:hypothetical protein